MADTCVRATQLLVCERPVMVPVVLLLYERDIPGTSPHTLALDGEVTRVPRKTKSDVF